MSYLLCNFFRMQLKPTVNDQRGTAIEIHYTLALQARSSISSSVAKALPLLPSSHGDRMGVRIYWLYVG